MSEATGASAKSLGSIISHLIRDVVGDPFCSFKPFNRNIQQEELFFSKKKLATFCLKERDHGDAWEMVDKILKGERASNPEAIMRARFTALRFKDPQFLAATEKEEGAPGRSPILTEGLRE